MLHLFGVSFVFLYIVAAALYVIGVVWRRDFLPKIARVLALTGFLFHTLGAAIVLSTISGISGGGDYLLWLAWVLMILFLTVELRKGTVLLGAFVVPIVAILSTGSSLLLHHLRPVHFAPQGKLLVLLHVAPAVVAEASLLFSGLLSMVYLIQERRIRLKKVDGLSLRGPSLESLEKHCGKMIFIGFVSMGLAIVTGAVWVLGGQLNLFLFDTRELGALLSWGLLGFLLHARRSLAWSQRKVSRVTVFGVLVLVATLVLLGLFGVNARHGF
ncbi:MAG: cytochrome c biogenesis protein CcsA [Bdellovibrionales bacterium]|nr:cytochrome c biogenesis protein CcsA [Bdellovibrionales bacterium]